MRHDDVASGYPISTSFRRLTGYQRDPWDRGVTNRLTDLTIYSLFITARMILIHFPFFLSRLATQ